MAVFPTSNLLFHLWAEGVNRYIRIGTINWKADRVRKYFTS